MILTPEQKEHAIMLIETGDTLETVRYFQQVLNVSAEEALILTEKLKEDQELPEPSPLFDEFRTLKAEMEKKPGVNVARLVGTIFMSIGLIMIGVVIFIVISNDRFARQARTVKGTVTRFHTYESSNDDGSRTTMYRPTFNYEFEGKAYTYESSSASSNPEYEIGEVLTVLVDPQKPTEVIIDSFFERWFVSVLVGSMGVLFTALGYLAYRFGR